MKEVWPDSGHKLIKLIVKIKTLKVSLKKGSWNNLFYGRDLTLISFLMHKLHESASETYFPLHNDTWHEIISPKIK